MLVRKLSALAAACFVLATSTAAFADGSITVDGERTKFPAGERYIGIQYEIKSPRDLATGQASGKRQHQPLCIVMTPGASTPAWFTAAATNEVLKGVTLDDGNVRFKLSRATVSEVKFYEKDGKQLSDVCLTFQSIDVVHVKSGATGSDSWVAK